LADVLAIVEERSRERGYPAVMDEDFAADMREIIENRKHWKLSDWD
jgi:hypothetical protein